jgi:hypothetical protein
MGLEVARQRGEISDETYQNMLRRFLPQMGTNAAEFNPPPELPALGPGQPANQPPPIRGGPQGRNE